MGPLDLLDTMRGRREEMVPPRRMWFVGGGNFKTGGERLCRQMKECAGPEPDHDVLDIGCGIGKMAVPLTKVLSPQARYEGFDIVEDAVRWCSDHITARHPNFRFQVVDLFNSRYNPAGGDSAAGLRLPYPDDSFDFAFANSIFTHLAPDVVENYVAEAARVLRPGGVFFATYFLDPPLDPADPARWTTPSAWFGVEHDGYRSVSRWTPEAALAHPERDVRARYARHGFEIADELGVVHGAWSGRYPGARSFQDFVIARLPSA